MGFFSDVFESTVDLVKDPLAFVDHFDEGKDPGSLLATELGARTPADSLRDLTGQTGVDAVREAQNIQELLGREALDEISQGQLRLEETLSPFVEFGTGLLPRKTPFGRGGDLFRGTIEDAINASPLAGLQDFATREALGNPALSGVNPEDLQASALITGSDLLGRERSDLLQALQLGQASASQQAAGQIQTGAGEADLLSQLGNVRAAGGIGQAQAQAQGAQNIAGLGGTIAGFFR